MSERRSICNSHACGERQLAEITPVRSRQICHQRDEIVSGAAVCRHKGLRRSASFPGYFFADGVISTDVQSDLYPLCAGAVRDGGDGPIN